jgi:EPS-associated MarR family transcriptional regulator
MFLEPCGSVCDKMQSNLIHGELSIKLIRELEKAPVQSQRALSRNCGVSLGSIHYCLNALIDKGYVKVQNFKNAQNKLTYLYILTPSGLNFKKELTVAFLKRKQAEYEILRKEIEVMKESLSRQT